MSVSVAPPSLSYELFPPVSRDAEQSVYRSIDLLADTNPDYVSVTYSGSTTRRRQSLELIEHLVQNTKLRPLAHLTCVGESRDSLEILIRHFLALGVRGVLALRGDLPADPHEWRGEFPFARYLIELIREVEVQHSAALAGGRLGVGVAAYPIQHPESPSYEHDIEVLLGKERAGANYAITQVYFRPEDYRQLVTAARKAGVSIPLIPGVIPLNSLRRLERVSHMAGVAPDPILAHALESASDESERHQIGVRWAVDLARAAFDDGAPGLHLYTFNDHAGSLDVIDKLQLPRTRTRVANTWATHSIH
ncbi:methylenetetrahydrofolate reductase [Glutamicibacter sp.]|uniref:methylenetetrahydrofolate reductase n=1 Tax=Glutamicibacter sp. TaxID=1931995 RepID=UPI002B46389D|nr:methylenetetrahydrofolate reductase [Glutamicibacter sp.]HJX76876.1 methylenetetrahydrofolate reductase [Glutamicibacter sp.]